MSDRPTHYSRLSPQPIEVIEAWGLNFQEGSILKYLARYRFKGTAAQDLRKLAWYATRMADQIEGKIEPPGPQA